MPTGSRYANFVAKRLLGVPQLQDHFLDYLTARVAEALRRLYPTSGLDRAVSFGLGAADVFSLAPLGLSAFDNAGNVVAPPNALVQAVPFENAATINYQVGVEYARRPYEAETNPRTGAALYTAWEDSLGRDGAPSSVAWDPGLGKLTFGLNSVCEAGVSHAGRTAVVWLNTPASPVAATAIVSGLVTWAGGENRLVVTGKLGQSGSPSVNPAHYTVLLLGLTVRRNEDLTLLPNVAYVGKVVGGGPGNPPAGQDLTGQFVYFLGAAGLNEVLEFDGAGHVKVRVKRWAGEAGDARQISVIDEAGNVLFRVEADGDLRAGHAGLAASPKLRLVEQHGEGTLGTDANVLILRNAIVGGGIQLTTQKQESAGFRGLVLLGGYEETVVSSPDAEMLLGDTHTPLLVPLSGAPANESQLKGASPGNLLGALNCVPTGVENAQGSVLVEGASGAGSGAGKFTVSQGGFVIDGCYRWMEEYQFTGIPAGATRYVGLDVSGVAYAIGANISSFQAEDVLLWRFQTDGAGNPINLVDLRRPLYRDGKRVTLTVGPSGTPTMFRTIGKAVACIGELRSPLAGTGDTRGFEVLVVGPTDEGTSPVVLPCSGITIRGLSKERARITFTALNGGLFNLNGKDDLAFRDLTLVADGGAPGAADPPKVGFYHTGAGTYCDRVCIENVDLVQDGGGDYWNGVLWSDSGGLRDCLLDGVRSSVVRDFGVVVAEASRCTLRGCYFAAASTPLRAAGELDGVLIKGGGYCQIEGCRLTLFAEHAVSLEGASQACCVQGCYSSETGTPAYEATTATLRHRFIGNVAGQVGPAAGTVPCITVDGQRCVVLGNVLQPNAGAAIKVGVRFEVNSVGCTALGNTTDAAPSVPVSDGGAGNLWQTATDGDPLNA